MRALLSTYGWRVDVEPMMGLAAQRAVPGAPVRMWAPPHCAAAEECHGPVVIGVVPTGVRR